MKFYKNPFLFITPALIIGIVLSNWMNDSTLSLMLMFSGVLLLVVSSKVGKLNVVIQQAAFLALFLSLGMFLYTMRNGGKSIINTLKKGDSSFILTIDEVSKSNNTWHKTVGTINGVLSDSAILDTKEKALFFVKGDFEIGDQLFVTTRLNKIENSNNPGEFDAVSYWRNKKINLVGFIGDDDYKILERTSISAFSNFFIGIRNSLERSLEEHFKGDQLGIAKALLLGDKGNLSAEVRGSFSNSGAMHVLAVSGLHVGIVMFLLLFVLQKFSRFISKKSALIITVCLVWLYAGITGFSPSVVRAALMFSLLIIGQLKSKRNNGLNTLFLSAFILLLYNPLLIYDIGFQLSYLAMIGILTMYKPISSFFLVKNKLLNKLWEGTAIGISAQICTVPLTLYYFHQFPNYFMITNIGIMALAGVILSLGIVLFITKVIPLISTGIAFLLGICIFLLLSFVQIVESLPYAVAKGFILTWWQVLLLYLVIFTIIIVKSKPIRIYILLPIFILFIGVIQFDRYERLISNEMIVYNSSDFVVTVKRGDQIICFHTARQDHFSRVEYMIRNYVGQVSGKVTYVKLKKGVSTMGTLESVLLKLESIQSGWVIKLNNSTYIIKTAYDRFDNNCENIIELPFLNPSEGNYSLKNGAFKVRI